jgi:hypothetical protein
VLLFLYFCQTLRWQFDSVFFKNIFCSSANLQKVFLEENRMQFLLDDKVKPTHVSTKRKTDALKRGFTVKGVQTWLKTISRRIQMYLQDETRRDAVFVYNVLESNCKKILTSSQRVSSWNRAYTCLISIWLNAFKRSVLWDTWTRG